MKATTGVHVSAPTRWALFLVGVIVLSLMAGLSVVSQIGSLSREVRTELTPLVRQAVRGVHEGDEAALAALVDAQADPAWRRTFLSQPQTFVPPLEGPVEVRQVRSLEGTDIVQATAVGTFDVEGISVPAHVFFYARPVDTSWKLTFPLITEHFGVPLAHELDRVTLVVYSKENRAVTPALADVPLLIAELEAITAQPWPPLRVVVELLGPPAGWAVSTSGAQVDVRVISSSVGWWSVEPKVDLRARVAWGILQAMSSMSPRRRAVAHAVARFWAGDIDGLHPEFDVPLVRAARPLVRAGRWPSLEESVVGPLEGYTVDEQMAIWSTASLWLLANGVPLADLSRLVDESDAPLFRKMAMTWFDRPLEEVEAQWQADVEVRYR
ncbi:MAG: hypothetical protein Q9O62_06210 [Ardenticatenia bacterium]|nr:hypothetical protein [Ardenticatenia bacterium]